jgi:hypothetical protein
MSTYSSCELFKMPVVGNHDNHAPVRACHEPIVFAEAMRWATMLKTAIDDMKMARL